MTPTYLAVLAAFTLACSGASPEPRTPRLDGPMSRTQRPASPPVSCPDCPPVTAPSCPDPPSCQLLYSDTQGWYCIDDPEVKGSNPEVSYCWYERDDCEQAYELIVKERPTVKRCRPHAPAYCYNKYSSRLQARRSSCAATMEHCERKRVSDSNDALPEDEYVFSPCTEQP